MARNFKVGIAAAAALVGLGAATLTPNPASALPAHAKPAAAPSSSELPALSGSNDIAGDVQDSIDKSLADAYEKLPPEIQRAVPAPAPTPTGTKKPAGRPSPKQPVSPQPAPPQPKPAPAPRPAGDCSNCVALTYDDGPVAETNRLLDTLRNHHAHASFMVVGTNAGKNEAVLKRMDREGHTIGNHTMTHPQLSTLDGATIGQQIDGTNDAVQHATGKRPHWLRPPYGDTSDAVSQAAADRGMSLALWSIDTRDWATRDAGATCQAAVDEARSGSVVLMHDIHASSVDAANCILDGLESKGLRAASLDEMIPDAKPGVTYTNR